MWSALNLHGGRALGRASSIALLISLSACAGDTPVSPGSPPPAGPSPDPVAPAPSDGSGLTLSRPDIVFNTVPGAALLDSATVSIGGPNLAQLTIDTRYGGEPGGDWLTAELNHGATSATLTLRAKSAPLPAGEYKATVLLAVPGVAAESLTVTARIVTGPATGLSAAKICFTMTLGDNAPNPDDVRITSVDGSPIDGLTATIGYDPGQPTGWLSTRLDPTTAPTRLWLIPNVDPFMPAGTYSATVLVASPQAGNSPVPIRVTLTINPFDAAKASRLNVHIEWEGPQNGGIATVTGNGGIFCQSVPGGAPPGPNCSAVLADGLGDIVLGHDRDWGARFIRWTGACTAEGPNAECTVHFSAPGTTQEVTAVYGTSPSTISNILLQGAGASGTVTFSAPVTVPGTGQPLTCRLVNGVPEQPCNGVIEAGTGTFTVTATPDPGTVFVHWRLGGLNGPNGPDVVQCEVNTPSCTLTFTQGGSNVDGIVTFAPSSNYALQVEVQGAGFVSWPFIPDRNFGDCPEFCTEYFAPGSTVAITAHSGGGTFLGWTDCPSASGTTCEVSMTGNRHVIARFSP